MAGDRVKFPALAFSFTVKAWVSKRKHWGDRVIELSRFVDEKPENIHGGN
jgi:hypothetical protein